MKLALFLILSASAMAFAKDAAPNQTINIEATATGFEPKQVDVKPGTKVTLNVKRTAEASCATEIKVPSKNIKKELPLNKVVKVDLGTLTKGEVRFACGMDMMSGVIVVN